MLGGIIKFQNDRSAYTNNVYNRNFVFAVNFRITASRFLNVGASNIQLHCQSLCFRKCLWNSMPGPGLFQVLIEEQKTNTDTFSWAYGEENSSFLGYNIICWTESRRNPAGSENNNIIITSD